MSRPPRQASSSSIYHVMIRGVGQQALFLDSRDCERFLKYLKEVKETSPFILYGYCLMKNHVHLLIRETVSPLAYFMKRISLKYALYFNRKYQRIGHVFQDRYKSENVEDDRYFLTVYRYILQNPVKAGICETPAQYRWSSYSEIFKSGSLVDSELPLAMLGKEGLVEFVNMQTDEACMDVE